jgi:hypothetical protein
LRMDSERRALWYLIVGASVFYVTVFRLPFLRPYPYGFLKSLSLVSYVLIALAVQGIDFLFSNFDFRFSLQKKTSRSAKVLSLVAGVLIALFVLFTLATFGLSIEQYFKPVPAFFDSDALKLRDLKKYVDDNAEIFLTDSAQVQKIPMGLAAYALLKNPLYGNVMTGYGSLDNAPDARVYDYALLARGEDPTSRGYQDNALWSNETFALYPRAQGVVANQALNAQTTAPQTLTFTLGAQEIISGTKTISTAQGIRDVTIALASFVPQNVRLTLRNQNAEIALTPGLTTFTAANISLPATLVMTPTIDAKWLDAAHSEIPHQLPDADATLFVPYVQLSESGGAENSPSRLEATLVRCTNQNASELDARCFVVNPTGETLTWRWIVRGTTAGTREERVMAQVESSGAPRTRIDISAVPTGFVNVSFDDAPPQTFSTSALPDGKYRGDLEILRGGILLARTALYNFEIKNQGNSFVRDTRASPPVILAR